MMGATARGSTCAILVHVSLILVHFGNHVVAVGALFDLWRLRLLSLSHCCPVDGQKYDGGGPGGEAGWRLRGDFGTKSNQKGSQK